LGKVSESKTYHLLPYHSLDVAAVGQALLENIPAYRAAFARLTGLKEGNVVRWFTFLLALHDVGKIEHC
jgi:CRISPR-associated endonuclease/helicase Cas3